MIPPPRTAQGSRASGASDERTTAAGRWRRRMMYRAIRLSGTALAVTMFAALAVALSAGAGAQEDQTMKVDLTQSRDSGVSGTARFEDVKGGVEVTLEMRNLPKQIGRASCRE